MSTKNYKYNVVKAGLASCGMLFGQGHPGFQETGFKKAYEDDVGNEE